MQTASHKGGAASAVYTFFSYNYLYPDLISLSLRQQGVQNGPLTEKVDDITG
jgi:hypothetical protein